MSTPHTSQPKSASQMVAEARKTVQEITAAQAKEKLDQGQIVLLDVREPDEWDQGHILGAILAPRGKLEWYADPTTPHAKPELANSYDVSIVVLCANGNRSLLAAETLKSMGYSNVVSMSGGFNAWVQQGFPVAPSVS